MRQEVGDVGGFVKEHTSEDLSLGELAQRL